MARSYPEREFKIRYYYAFDKTKQIMTDYVTATSKNKAVEIVRDKRTNVRIQTVVEA